MKVAYNPEVDIMPITLTDAKVQESDESLSGIVMDYDRKGNLVGIEILNASKKVKNLNSIEVKLPTFTTKKRSRVAK